MEVIMKKDMQIYRAMRVRRSSDNAEQNFKFTSFGTLDKTAILNFVGKGKTDNGYRTDKSNVAANQPIIVKGGLFLSKLQE